MRPLASVTIALVLFPASWTSAGSPSPEEAAATARWAAALQNPDGGFAATPGGASSLGATSSAAKVLRYTGGSIRDVAKAIEFVASCFDPHSGGFAPSPGGGPDVGTTAAGLMAVGELKMPADPYVSKAVDYFHEHAKTFPEIRIAVAGLEAVGAKSGDFPAWIELVKSDRNADGLHVHQLACHPPLRRPNCEPEHDNRRVYLPLLRRHYSARSRHHSAQYGRNQRNDLEQHLLHRDSQRGRSPIRHRNGWVAQRCV